MGLVSYAYQTRRSPMYQPAPGRTIASDNRLIDNIATIKAMTDQSHLLRSSPSAALFIYREGWDCFSSEATASGVSIYQRKLG